MNLDRFKRLIDAAGASPDRWPGKEREEALALLNISPEARQQLEQAEALDTLLDGFTVPADTAQQQRLARSIMESTAIRPDPLSRLIEWLLPPDAGSLRLWWRPILAASMPLIAGIAIGLNANPLQDSRMLMTDEEELAVMAISWQASAWQNPSDDNTRNRVDE